MSSLKALIALLIQVEKLYFLLSFVCTPVHKPNEANTNHPGSQTSKES